MSRLLAPRTANDRFKQRQGRWMGAGLLVGVAAHVAAFALVQIDVRALAATATEPQVVEIDIPPEARLRGIPTPIERPATPRVAPVTISEKTDLVLPILPGGRPPGPRAGVGPEQVLPEIVVPPPSGPWRTPRFIPYDTPPRLLNGEDVRRAIADAKADLSRSPGAPARVELWLYVTDVGTVSHAQVRTATGRSDLDQAALRVALVMRFSPAENRGRATPVWVTRWVTFGER